MDNGEYHGSISHNNIPNGLGIYYYKDGSIYQGEIAMKEKHYRGIYILSDGSIYDGGWVKDKMCGEATFTDLHQNLFKGYFKNNQKEGQGKMTYKNGETLEGNWVNGYEEG